jgi:hypothetical protein
MTKKQNPAGGNRQGSGIVSDFNTSINTAAPHQNQPEFQPATWIAARFRVALPTARLHAELFGIGGAK